MHMAAGYNHFRLSLPALALMLAAQGSMAQESFLIDAGPCLALDTAVERLVCFEQQVREAQELQGVAPAVVTRPAPSQPAAAQPAAPQAAVPQVAAPQAGAAQATAPQAAAPQATAPQAAAPQAAAPTGEAAFGLPEEPSRAVPDELRGTVASVRQFAPNQVTLTLTNGQVWRQKRADRYGVKEGHNVRIYSTRWGNDYRLSVEDLGGFIQVERVK